MIYTSFLFYIKVKALKVDFLYGHELMRRWFANAVMELNAHISLHFVKADIRAFFEALKDLVLLL